MRKYLEGLVAAGGAAAVALAAYLTDGFTTTEKVLVAVAAFGALQTFVASNVDLPYWDQTKAIVFGLHAALIALVAALTADGVSAAEWVEITAAALAAAGIWKTPSYVAAEPVPPAAGPEPFPPTTRTW